MLGLEGIPGIYIHSLLGTKNDHDKLAHTHHNRAINRHRWQAAELEERLNHVQSFNSQILRQLLALIDIRKAQPAFHPNATQFTLHLGLSLFGFWRQSQDKQQSIFCISNVTKQAIELPINELNLIITESWFDLISLQAIDNSSPKMPLAPYQTVWITNKIAN
jgi:sucrose phosphorylase